MDNGNWGAAHDAIQKQVDDVIPEDVPKRVIYSAYDEENGLPVSNLDAVAIQGKCVLVEDINEFWGGRRSRAYQSPEMENPTWLQVAVRANDMIRRTNDLHHVYLEDVEFDEQATQERNDGVAVWRFIMGS